MKLRRLSSAEFDEFEAATRMAGITTRQCPTCGSKPFRVVDEVLGEAEGRLPGFYRHKGSDHRCDCESQMMLRKHYLVAGIGDQYMRLDWTDYRDATVRADVDNYLAKWPSFKVLGMGIEFSGEGLGTGKTMAATHVGKELIKRGERVFFVHFLDLISLYEREETERERIAHRLRETTVLILDEVVPPYTSNQGALFADKLEALIRHRTNFNLPTIIGTNLLPDALRSYYPRSYSLLEAKQMRIEMKGADARAGWIGETNLELALNGEVPPIT